MRKSGNNDARLLAIPLALLVFVTWPAVTAGTTDQSEKATDGTPGTSSMIPEGSEDSKDELPESGGPIDPKPTSGEMEPHTGTVRIVTSERTVMERCRRIYSYSLFAATRNEPTLWLALSCDAGREKNSFFDVRKEDLLARRNALDRVMEHYLVTKRAPCLMVVQRHPVQDIDILWGDACEAYNTGVEQGLPRDGVVNEETNHGGAYEMIKGLIM